MSRLTGKTAIVTGAARGSGAAIARRFVAEGADVVVADVRDEQGEATAVELGARARYVRCDVTSEADWGALMGSVERLDVLVNNAAVLLLADLASTTVEQYLRVMQVNELGTFLGIRAAIEPMRATGGGSIINISSIDGHYVAPLTGAYAASKFAVRGLTKVAALELGPFGIRVNAICPAAGNRQMVVEALPDAFKEAFAKASEAGGGHGMRPPPVGRHGTVDDVADAAVFLASDESSFFTGADFVLDGGTSAGMRLPSGP